MQKLFRKIFSKKEKATQFAIAIFFLGLIGFGFHGCDNQEAVIKKEPIAKTELSLKPEIEILSSLENQGDKQEYLLEFKTKNADDVSVVGDTVTETSKENGRFISTIWLARPSNAVKIVAKNKYGTTEKTLTITRDLDETEKEEKNRQEQQETKLRQEKQAEEDKKAFNVELYKAAKNAGFSEKDADNVLAWFKNGGNSDFESARGATASFNLIVIGFPEMGIGNYQSLNITRTCLDNLKTLSPDDGFDVLVEYIVKAQDLINSPGFNSLSSEPEHLLSFITLLNQMYLLDAEESRNSISAKEFVAFIAYLYKNPNALYSH